MPVEEILEEEGEECFREENGGGDLFLGERKAIFGFLILIFNFFFQMAIFDWKPWTHPF